MICTVYKYTRDGEEVTRILLEVCPVSVTCLRDILNHLLGGAMLKLLDKKQLEAIGEVISVFDYKMDTTMPLKDVYDHIKNLHQVENSEDIQLLQGFIVRCVTRTKKSIINTPAVKPDDYLDKPRKKKG
jgi:hypothetical protein